MKLSLIFELLLIFVLLAFAASKHVGRKRNNKTGVQHKNSDVKIEDNSINRYCKCSELFCNCCRDFQVPLVNLSGPGCATLMYLNDDKMSVSLSFGRKVITNRTMSSRKPSPVCMPLPGGISKFCGRVYNIARTGEEFRACLGLELQSKSTVEAAVRVSCFKFGPRGVTSEPADPLPLVPQDEKNPDDDEDDYEDDDDDDDDDDGFGLTGDDEYEEADDDDDDGGELDAANDVDSADYTGFSLLGEDLLGDLFGSGSKKSNKNKKKQAPIVQPSSTTRRPRPTRRPSRRPASRVTTVRPFVTRTTTVKIRPISRRPTRRPTRRPNGRPTRRPQTSEETTANSTPTISTTTFSPIVSNSVPPRGDEQESLADLINQETTFTEKLSAIQSLTTLKPEPTFEDPSLQMSLAHITGQLSVMPITPEIPDNDNGANKKITSPAEVLYEKIETMTPKTVPFIPTERIQDDMIQIVQNLDSQSEELTPEKESPEQTRSNKYKNTLSSNYYEGLTIPKKKHRGSDFQLADLDVLDLTQIGESVGHQLGIFGRSKRQDKNKGLKHNKENKNNDDYEDIIGDLSETMGFADRKGNKNIDNRSRQNKMMRGAWSQT